MAAIRLAIELPRFRTKFLKTDQSETIRRLTSENASSAEHGKERLRSAPWVEESYSLAFFTHAPFAPSEF